MAERDLEAMLARMAKNKVNRRSFLATSGLLGTSAFLAACSSGGASQRRPVGSGAVRGPVDRGRVRRAGRRRRVGAVRLQLERLHLPDEHRRVQGGVRGRQLRLRHVRQQRGAASPSSRAARPGYDICCPTAEYVPGMVEEGFITKLDMSRIPNAATIEPGLPEPVVGPEQRVPRPQGLRHDRHPVAQRTRVSRAGKLAGVQGPRRRRGLGQDGLRRLDGRRHGLPAQDPGLLAQLRGRERARGGAPDPAGGGAARPGPRLGHLRRQDGQR